MLALRVKQEACSGFDDRAKMEPLELRAHGGNLARQVGIVGVEGLVIERFESGVVHGWAG